MTIDDDNSVYVGGLAYDTTEDSLRKTFHTYGHVIAVKIINDRGVGGKCFGFVTFTSPRSAVDAIKGMNGRTIGGRIVRVNDVKTKGGRENFSRTGFRRNFERSLSNKGRDRDRDYARNEDHHRDRKRDRSRDHDRDRERGYSQEHNHDQARDRSMDRNRERGRIKEEDNREQEQERERDHELVALDSEVERSNHHLKSGEEDIDQEFKKLNGSHYSDRYSREHSSESRDDEYEVEELKSINQQLEELRKQVSQMEDMAEQKQLHVSKLQEDSQELEDALTAAKKLSSHRKMQLIKLSRCYLHMKDFNERLKSSEQELQSLIDTTEDVDDGGDLDFKYDV